MNTYTPYARQYDTRHGVSGFYASDYKLAHAEQLEIAEYLADALQQAIKDGDTIHLQDIASMIVSENWMPVYYSDTLRIWTDSGCPEPEYYEPHGETTIWDMMNAAIFETGLEFANALVWVDDDEYQTALDRINTLYPVKTEDPKVVVMPVGF